MRGRSVSIAAVIVLHVVIVVALLRAVVVTPMERAQEREIVLPLALPFLAQPSTAPAKGGEQRGVTAVPDFSHTPFLIPAPQASALGAALFGCALENRDNLTAQEQARCDRIALVDLNRLKDGLPTTIKLPGPAWEGLRNSDLRARERNTADPCMAAKATGTECIHEIIYGKGLW